MDLEDIASYLKCAILSVFKYINDFDELVKLKVLRKAKSERRRRRCPDRLDSMKFYVPVYIIQSISNGDEKLPSRQKPNLTIYEVLDAFGNLLQERNNELVSQEEFDEETISLLHENHHLPFVKLIQGFKLNQTDLLLLLYVCAEFTDFDDANLITFLKVYCSDNTEQMSIRKEFLRGENRLQQLNLITTPSDNFQSDRTLILTEYSKELFFGEDKDLFNVQDQRKSDIILSSDIIPQKLFFNKKEEEQLAFLTDLLQPDNYQTVCSRMKDMGMRTGFTILLYGEPGVGKTESCFQLAKQTGNRSIYKVDIAETSSKWFGESQKLIKGIFNHYGKLVSKYDLTPIMLLNECDGVLGKRQVGSHSSVSQTENAMQNLMLEGLEQFSGILIATTNLTQNLDKAFERRFLYKLQLKKPDSQTRCLIWRDKIQGLTDIDYQTLSENLELSGGQIDNISRKYILNQILSGEKLNLSQIMDLCNEEFLDKAGERRKIGFLT
jgi:AAA+ superfamily predicted ATPase